MDMTKGLIDEIILLYRYYFLEGFGEADSYLVKKIFFYNLKLQDNVKISQYTLKVTAGKKKLDSTIDASNWLVTNTENGISIDFTAFYTSNMDIPIQMITEAEKKNLYLKLDRDSEISLFMEDRDKQTHLVFQDKLDFFDL